MAKSIDPKLMKMGEEAFWEELNAKREEDFAERRVRQYLVIERNKKVTLLVTDAELVFGTKIEV